MLLPLSVTLFAISTIVALPQPPSPPPPITRPENDTHFWLHEAETFVQQQHSARPNTAQARNAAIFIGSGMSMTTLAAARVYIGTEQTQLAFERFPGVGMLRTYCVDQQVADEACAATALFGGCKTNRGTVGVTAQVTRGQCAPPSVEQTVESLAQQAIAAGKWVGVVTTGRVTSSAVSALYAHAADAKWENDARLRADGCDPLAVRDIAQQLVYGEVGAKLRVVLGGGRREFRAATMADERGERGARSDGRDLLGEWQALKMGRNASYVWRREEFRALDAEHTDYLLGLFAHGDLHDNLRVRQEEQLAEEQPTLAEMTEKALQILRRNPEGFMLFVVNEQIDAAHHRNWARVALDETAELDAAVEVAKRMTDERETLLVVTADHAHTMTYSGYPIRHNDIFGMADYGTWVGDGMPIMTLSYAAGAGFANHMKANGRRERIDPTTLESSGRDFAFPATMPAAEEMHGGDDVAVYARGPWAHLFGGSAEQSVLAHVVRFAACLGGTNDVELNACNVEGMEL